MNMRAQLSAAADQQARWAAQGRAFDRSLAGLLLELGSTDRARIGAVVTDADDAPAGMVLIGTRPAEWDGCRGQIATAIAVWIPVGTDLAAVRAAVEAASTRARWRKRAEQAAAAARAAQRESDEYEALASSAAKWLDASLARLRPTEAR